MSNLLVHNVHPVERLVRAVIGLGLLTLAFTGPRTPLGYIGLVPLLTAVVGSCPLYTVFGFSTCHQKAR